jgi:potassium-dependent mechanosensitive channel
VLGSGRSFGAKISTIWIYPHPPRVVMNAVGGAILLPAVLIVRRLAPPAMRPTVYALAALFLIDRIRETCSVVAVLERWVFLVEMLLGIGFLVLVVRSETLLIEASGREASGWRRVFTCFLWAPLPILAIALVTGALGYMRLARLLGGQVLTASYVALVLYAAVPVGEGLVAYALHTPPLRRLLMVARHRDLLQRRTHLALHWLAVGVWIYLTLDEVGLLDPLWSAAETVLDARYVRGSISISLGDTLAFVLTIWASFLLSSFVRFVLGEDVYPRVGFPRGASYAVSSLVHYTVVLGGFLVAIAALGLDLTRITILAGAFGLGAGIGLQGAVANFVSGLILLLEGRIRVGDSVQMDNLEGEVREIRGRGEHDPDLGWRRGDRPQWPADLRERHQLDPLGPVASRRCARGGDRRVRPRTGPGDPPRRGHGTPQDSRRAGAPRAMHRIRGRCHDVRAARLDGPVRGVPAGPE